MTTREAFELVRGRDLELRVSASNPLGQFIVGRVHPVTGIFVILGVGRTTESAFEASAKPKHER